MCLYMCVSVWRGVLLYGGKDGQGLLKYRSSYITLGTQYNTKSKAVCHISENKKERNTFIESIFYKIRTSSKNLFLYTRECTKPISVQCSHFIPSKNIKKTFLFRGNKWGNLPDIIQKLS